MDTTGREILERNIRNLNEGVTHAEKLVSAMLDYDAARARAGTLSILEFIHSLDDDARDQMIIAAFTTLVQYRDRLRDGL